MHSHWPNGVVGSVCWGYLAMFNWDLSTIWPMRRRWWVSWMNSSSVFGNRKPKGCVSAWNCSGDTPTALSSIRDAVSMDTAPPPSSLALWRTISNRLIRASTLSLPRREKPKRSCVALRRNSSSKGANLCAKPWRRYVMGSTCCPFTIPPAYTSFGVMVRATSLAAPPSWLMINAHCWCGWRSEDMVHNMRSWVQDLKDTLLAGSQRGGRRDDWVGAPGCHMWQIARAGRKKASIAMLLNCPPRRSKTLREETGTAWSWLLWVGVEGMLVTLGWLLSWRIGKLYDERITGVANGTISEWPPSRLSRRVTLHEGAV